MMEINWEWSNLNRRIPENLNKINNFILLLILNIEKSNRKARSADPNPIKITLAGFVV